MKKLFVGLSVLTVAFCLLTFSDAVAEIPQVINYQGKLTNAQGQLIDGTYSVTFTLFTQASGGGTVWTENHGSVAVTNGLFNVLLGSVEMDTLGAIFEENDYLYLQIQIGSEILSPRQPLASVGYALQAEEAASAATINGLSAADLVPIGTILAWHKDLSGTPVLPSGWLECNGQTVSDEESPYNGQTLPDLNGDARFLRGSATSGTLQAHQLQNHTHSFSPNHKLWEYDGAEKLGKDTSNGWIAQAAFSPSVGNPNSGNYGDETRPSNMSVVWIIKIK